MDNQNYIRLGINKYTTNQWAVLYRWHSSMGNRATCRCELKPNQSEATEQKNAESQFYFLLRNRKNISIQMETNVSGLTKKKKSLRADIVIMLNNIWNRYNKGKHSKTFYIFNVQLNRKRAKLFHFPKVFWFPVTVFPGL